MELILVAIGLGAMLGMCASFNGMIAASLLTFAFNTAVGLSEGDALFDSLKPAALSLASIQVGYLVGALVFFRSHQKESIPKRGYPRLRRAD